jgi:ABC-type antimicrobial peptide transport system permease subunit
VHFSREADSRSTYDAKEEHDMIAIESILYGLLGGLVGLKAFLLGLAAVLFMHTLTERKRRNKMASMRVSAPRARLDIHA